MAAKKFRIILILLVSIPILLGLCVGATWLNIVGQLHLAKIRGLYSSPEEGMRTMLNQSYQNIQKIEIEYAGTNSFDGSLPHVWFVTGKVWAEKRADGHLLGKGGYDYPGSYFIKTKDGWVHVPEGAFPELIGLGMQIFGIN
jgi:hypothetical protein